MENIGLLDIFGKDPCRNNILVHKPGCNQRNRRIHTTLPVSLFPLPSVDFSFPLVPAQLALPSPPPPPRSLLPLHRHLLAQAVDNLLHYCDTSVGQCGKMKLFGSPADIHVHHMDWD